MSHTETAPPKTWLITGCATGFGRAIALAALARGDRVLLTARDLKPLADVAAAYPLTARVARLDVTDAGEAADAVVAAERAFGGLDVLVNNAGFTRAGAVEEMSPEEYRPLYETNLFGSVNLMRAALPGMRERGTGCIVNISSAAGLLVNAGMGHYGATKFALEALSEALAAEVRELGIRVLIVEPGLFRTNIGVGFDYAKAAMDVYRTTARVTYERFHGGLSGAGDTDKAAAAIVAAVNDPDAPLRLPLGAGLVDRAKARFDGLIRNLDACAEVAEAMTADGNS